MTLISCGRAMVCIGFALLVPGTAQAQRGFPDREGIWKLSANAGNAAADRLDAAQSKLFLSKFQEIASLLHTAKVFNPPRGYNASITADLCCTTFCEMARTCASLPAFGRLDLMLLYFAESRGGQPATDIELRTEAEFEFNNPYAVFDGDAVVTLPDSRKVAWAPAPWRQVGSVTLYENHTRARGIYYIFLTKHGTPLWVPVSREQFLVQLIREREAELNRTMPKARVAMERERDPLVAPLRTQLAGMTAAERASQAWILSKSEISPLVPEGTQRAHALVAVNPDYFDRSRARTDLQLITVRLKGIPEEGAAPPFADAEAVGKARLWEFVNQVDWPRIAAMIQ